MWRDYERKRVVATIPVVFIPSKKEKSYNDIE